MYTKQNIYTNKKTIKNTIYTASPFGDAALLLLGVTSLVLLLGVTAAFVRGTATAKRNAMRNGRISR